jgi:hypothetical protein
MWTRLFLAIALVLFSSFAAPVRATQQNDASQSNDDTTIEGTVVSSSRQTLVVRTDDQPIPALHLRTPIGSSCVPRSGGAS